MNQEDTRFQLPQRWSSQWHREECITCIFQMRKLRLRPIESIAQGHPEFVVEPVPKVKPPDSRTPHITIMPRRISAPFGSFHPTFSLLFLLLHWHLKWGKEPSPARLPPTANTNHKPRFNYACMPSPFSCVWLFGNLMDCSLLGCSVHGIFQGRILLEWVAMPSSRGIFPDPGIKHVSPALQVNSLPLSPWGSPDSGQLATHQRFLQPLPLVQLIC